MWSYKRKKMTTSNVTVHCRCGIILQARRRWRTTILVVDAYINVSASASVGVSANVNVDVNYTDVSYDGASYTTSASFFYFAIEIFFLIFVFFVFLSNANLKESEEWCNKSVSLN